MPGLSVILYIIASIINYLDEMSTAARRDIQCCSNMQHGYKFAVLLVLMLVVPMMLVMIYCMRPMLSATDV